MKCPFCSREINPEITQRLERWGRTKDYRCPRCNMFLKRELEGWNKLNLIYGWKSIKEMLEERDWISELYKEHNIKGR